MTQTKVLLNVFRLLFFFFFFTCSFLTASFRPDDQDGVNFLMGVDAFNLTFHQPHFPGYPVYIAAGKILNEATGSPEIALVLLSVLAATACLICFYSFIKKQVRGDTAVLATAILGANPLFFEFSHKIFSEMPALALFLIAITLLGDPGKASKNKWVAVSVLFGLLLGIRLSWWPLSFCYIAYAIPYKKISQSIIGFTIGICLWLLPLIAITGLDDLVINALSFTGGHFNEWGGALSNETGFVERLKKIGFRFVEISAWKGYGVYWTLLPWILFSTYCCAKQFYSKVQIKPENRLLLSALLLYFLWIIFGQNPNKVRHFIPFVLLFPLLTAPVIEKNYGIALCTVFLLAVTTPYNYLTEKRTLSPTLAFKSWADSSPLPINSVFYCGNSERFFDRYPMKKFTVVNAKNDTHLKHQLASSWPLDQTVYVCDDIPGFTNTGSPVAIFPARKGDPVDIRLRIFKRNGEGGEVQKQSTAKI